MEVIATIRFIRPCLGNIRQDPSRKETYDRMPRDKGTGKVVFQQTWWRAGLGYAAQALCRFQKDVTNVQTDPFIEGETTVIKRYWRDQGGNDHFTEHEAFDTGTLVKVRFCLPPRIKLADFKELLAMSGRYVGISPYGYREDWGRFLVENVEPVNRSANHGPHSSNPPPRQLDKGDPGLPSNIGAQVVVHQAGANGRK